MGLGVLGFGLTIAILVGPIEWAVVASLHFQVPVVRSGTIFASWEMDLRDILGAIGIFVNGAIGAAVRRRRIM